MADILSAASGDNGQGSSLASSAMGQTVPRKPRIKVGLLDASGSTVNTLSFDGRDAWALNELVRAGKHGCTPIDNPAPRWSHYVFKLRRAGLNIRTHDEPHGGPYAGHHARYELLSDLVVIDSSFAEADAA